MGELGHAHDRGAVTYGRDRSPSLPIVQVNSSYKDFPTIRPVDYLVYYIEKEEEEEQSERCHNWHYGLVKHHPDKASYLLATSENLYWKPKPSL